MKLYHFNPNDYGNEWYVMSDSEENAIKALNEKLSKTWDYPLQWGDSYFKSKEINGVNISKGYTIDVYGINQVIESEIA